MADTDAQLDAKSRRLLETLDDIKSLEQEKRATARSSDHFHELAAKVESKARDVFAIASTQLEQGEGDSPLPQERAEQAPGDWTTPTRRDRVRGPRGGPAIGADEHRDAIQRALTPPRGGARIRADLREPRS